MKAYQALAAMVLGLTAAAAQAQMTPVGLWKSVDDKSGEAKSEIRVAENDGVCLLYTSPSQRDRQKSRMPSSA